MKVKFTLRYCGIEESDEFDAANLTPEEIEKELVSWVLDRVDHWVEADE